MMTKPCSLWLQLVPVNLSDQDVVRLCKFKESLLPPSHSVPNLLQEAKLAFRPQRKKRPKSLWATKRKSLLEASLKHIST
jgi:hypothetical protein